jgi:hypothetical protein
MLQMIFGAILLQSETDIQKTLHEMLHVVDYKNIMRAND